jgi:hypothetical protein
VSFTYMIHVANALTTLPLHTPLTKKTTLAEARVE